MVVSWIQAAVQSQDSAKVKQMAVRYTLVSCLCMEIFLCLYKLYFLYFYVTFILLDVTYAALLHISIKALKS